jgi:hypothetical protein
MGRNEKNLTIRKFSKRKKKQVQTLPTGRTIQWILFWLKGIARKDLRLAQPHNGFWF